VLLNGRDYSEVVRRYPAHRPEFMDSVESRRVRRKCGNYFQDVMAIELDYISKLNHESNLFVFLWIGTRVRVVVRIKLESYSFRSTVSFEVRHDSRYE